MHTVGEYMQNYIFFGTGQASTAIIVGGVMTENAVACMSVGVCLRINRIFVGCENIAESEFIANFACHKICHHYENRRLYTYTILQEPLHILRFL